MSRRRRVESVPSKGVASVLEVVGGLFWCFGLGHLYAGKVLSGLFLLVFGLVVLAVNVALCFVGIGACTLPLCWVLGIVLCAVSAAASCPAPYDD